MIEPIYQADRFTLYLGDCIEVMRELPEASVDAIVTDPPYGIGFMGREWDTFDPDALAAAVDQHARKSLLPGRSVLHEGRAWEAGRYDRSREANRQFQAWCETWAREAYRVLKPGAFLVAFGGTRTDHRLACGIEDAGFEIRNTLAWMFGSGFPKSLDVERAVAMEQCGLAGRHWMRKVPPPEKRQPGDHVCPETPDSLAWAGFGTDLKPGFEPARVARKPLAGNVAQNVLAHGTGAINVDGCRIETAPGDYGHSGNDGIEDRRAVYGDYAHGNQSKPHTSGRWPANVILDEEAAALLDATAGQASFNRAGMFADDQPAGWGGGTNSIRGGGDATRSVFGYGDRGGPSRFFYTAKADRSEREAGLEDLPPALRTDGRPPEGPGADNPRLRVSERRNDHPTVKPVSLMRWLCKLITPPGGVVLDPFIGSGTTGMAALDEGFRFIGIDMTERYVEIARYRVTHRHVIDHEVREATPEVPQGRLI